MRDLAFLIVYALPLALCWGSVVASVLNWTWIAILAPSFLMYGVGTLIPFNKVVAALTVLAFLVSKERKRFRCDRIGVVLLLFLLMVFLAQMNALVDSDMGWELLDKFWKVVVLYFLVVSFIDTPQRIHALLLTLCIATGFDAVGDGLKFFLSGGSFHSIGTQAWGDNNQEALFILMCIPLLIYLRSVMTDRRARWGLAAVITLYVVAIIATASRGALVGLLVIGFAGFMVSQRKIVYVVGALALGGMLVVVAPPAWTTRMDTIQTADQDNSFMGRVIAWKLSTLIALDHPLLGGGLHAVQNLPVWNTYKLHFEDLSFIPTAEPDVIAHAAHSIYFEVLGDTGFIGLFLYLSMLIGSLVRLRATVRRARSDPELAWAAALGSQLIVTILVYMVSGAALSVAYFDEPILILGIGAALALQVRSKVPQQRRGRAGLRLPGAQGVRAKLAQGPAIAASIAAPIAGPLAAPVAAPRAAPGARPPRPPARRV